MAAGGSDLLSGDVEEDASQLIFPKGESGGCAIVPSSRLASAVLALPRGPAGRGAAAGREEVPAELEGPGRPSLVPGEGRLEPSAPVGAAPDVPGSLLQ